MKRVLVLGLALLAAVAAPAPSAEPALPYIPAIKGLPIPSLPTDLLVPSYVGAPAAAQPMKAPPVPQNPYLAPNGTSSMHNDAYSTDAYAVSGPLGKGLRVRSASYGIRECATVSFDSLGRLEALCGGLEGFVMMLIDPLTLRPLAELPMPGRDLSGLSNPFRGAGSRHRYPVEQPLRRDLSRTGRDGVRRDAGRADPDQRQSLGASSTARYEPLARAGRPGRLGPGLAGRLPPVDVRRAGARGERPATDRA